MPKAKSAIKQARASLRKRAHNQSIKHRISSGIRQFQQMLKENPQGAREHAKSVVSWLDRAAKTRVLHVNTARRHKASVMAKLQAIAK
jgi:small subunit ribosomal protein S20